MQPTQFRMHVSTGAPPDLFATQGQNWGFPTYQWAEMEKDGYSFWRRRLTHMSQCAPPCAPHPPDFCRSRTLSAQSCANMLMTSWSIFDQFLQAQASVDRDALH